MKEIRAVCRPDRLHALRQALREIPGFPGLTVLEVKGFSAPALINNATLEAERSVFATEGMTSLTTREGMVDSIIDVLVRAGPSGRIGEAMVWSVSVEVARRIQDASLL